MQRADVRAGQQQPRLERPEGDRQARTHGRSLDRAGVGVDAARQVDRDDVAPVELLHQRGGSRAQRTAPADADEPVDDQAGTELLRPPGRPPRGRPSSASARGSAGEHGAHPRTAAGQPHAGPQRVRPVVAAADEQHDVGGVDPAEPSGDRRGETGAARCISRPLASSGLAASAARTCSTVCAYLTTRPPPPRSRPRRRATATGARSRCPAHAPPARRRRAAPGAAARPGR